MFLSDKKNCKTGNIGLQLARPILTAALLGLISPLFASNPVSGQLVVINGLACLVNGSVGESASSVKIVVNDSTGPCSTTATVVYRGFVVVPWANSNIHSANSCTDIVSVEVTALKKASGLIQYDSIANTTPPAVATAATMFIAPTTPITNLSLIITGGASPATVGSATAWNIALGVKPVYDTTNGSIVTTGIMGGVGSSGFKAEQVMRRYSVNPAQQTM